jgi:hypothetical protein
MVACLCLLLIGCWGSREVVTSVISAGGEITLISKGELKEEGRSGLLMAIRVDMSVSVEGM